MPQTSYDLDFQPMLPGAINESIPFEFSPMFLAVEAIKPGRVCEIVPGTEGNTTPSVRHAQSTGGPIARLAGISTLRLTKQNPASGNAADYAAGDQVQLLRKGVIAVEAVVGTTAGQYDQLRVSHSSTVATDRGKVTSAAASATAGSEVSADLGSVHRPGVVLTDGVSCVSVGVMIP